MYLIPPCLTLSNIRYVSKVKWSNPGKGVTPSPTLQCSSYWKGSLLVALDYGRQLYFSYMYIGQVVRVFAGKSGYNPRSSHAKTQKWYLMPPCLIFNIIRYGSRVKWRNPGEEVAPFTTPRCRSYGAFGSLSTAVANFTLTYIYICSFIYIYKK